MSRESYWEESLRCSLEDLEITLTDEQIKYIASDLSKRFIDKPSTSLPTIKYKGNFGMNN